MPQVKSSVLYDAHPHHFFRRPSQVQLVTRAPEEPAIDGRFPSLHRLICQSGSQNSEIFHSLDHWFIMCANSLQSYRTLCNPMDYSPPGSSVYEILQARILEWVAIPFPRGSSWPRDEPMSLASPALADGFFTTSATWFIIKGTARGKRCTGQSVGKGQGASPRAHHSPPIFVCSPTTNSPNPSFRCFMDMSLQSHVWLSNWLLLLNSSFLPSLEVSEGGTERSSPLITWLVPLATSRLLRCFLKVTC